MHAHRVTTVPRFVSAFEDLEIKGNTRFDGFADQSLRDHPAVTDTAYRNRRGAIIDQVMASGDGLPHITYNENEIKAWGDVLRKMKEEVPNKACKQYNKMFQLLGFREDQIPILTEISDRLYAHSGWRLHAVGGYVEPRVFLNCLNFRVFPVIPFVRHHDRPFYSIEPDICHELLGHVPMLADQDFAELCSYIGRASLNASDEMIDRIANVYWHFVEFGLVQEGEGRDGRKAFGAAVVSCIDELNNALSEQIEIKSFDPTNCAADGEHPLTEVQPSYYIASSIEEAKVQIKHYVDEVVSATTMS